MPHTIDYTLTPIRPEAHLFEVTCTVADPDPAGQRFALPAWIPGSYMIREFAKNIVSLRAEAGGRPLAIDKLDKHTWCAAPTREAITVSYRVYAWDLSVRTAHLDQTHGFVNGTSVFLRVLGREDRPHRVELRRPEGLPAYAGWRVATTLPEARGVKGAAKRYGFGLYQAADYDTLVDHPIEMGSFTLARFEACGVPHEVAITGRHDCDVERLCADLKKICEWQIRLFGEPAPMERYLFLVMAVGDGYGGLEHRASTALICSRDDLPHAGMQAMSEGYRGFLGLCSHEYFHTWNVKRIKPAAFVPYDLSQENYTRLLWAFEGFTSYYDDLCLVRSGVIGVDDYLKLLAKTCTQVRRGPGRLVQSVAESSFDAWIKYYRQDENTPNAVVSYYTKGALIALGLDLLLRAESGGKKCLDDVMRLLWQRHGQTGVGVAEEGVFAAVAEVGGDKPARWLKKAVAEAAELPLERLLQPFAVRLAWEAPKDAAAGYRPALGLRTASEGSELKVAQVFDGGPAQSAGLSAGDVLVAVDGLKAGPNLDKVLARKTTGDALWVVAFRRDELMEFRLTLQAPPQDNAALTPAERPSAAARALRKGWLGR